MNLYKNNNSSEQSVARRLSVCNNQQNQYQVEQIPTEKDDYQLPPILENFVYDFNVLQANSPLKNQNNFSGDSGTAETNYDYLMNTESHFYLDFPLLKNETNYERDTLSENIYDTYIYSGKESYQLHSELCSIQQESISPQQDIPSHYHHSKQELKNEKGCKCMKSECLKLYCVCYAKGQKCLESCKCKNCKNCKNLEDFHEIKQIINKRKIIKNDKKIDSNSGCNCKRSKCQKKYCECFMAGKNCGPLCKCSNCCNGNHDNPLIKIHKPNLPN